VAGFGLKVAVYQIEKRVSRWKDIPAAGLAREILRKGVGGSGLFLRADTRQRQSDTPFDTAE
jgi:hypothetical protein